MTQSWQQPSSAGHTSAVKVNRFLPAAPGIALIVVGTAALAIQMGWLEARDLWRLWPVALIAAGLSQLWDWWRDNR